MTLTSPDWLNHSYDLALNGSIVQATNYMYSVSLFGWFWIIIYVVVVSVIYGTTKSDALLAGSSLVFGVFLVYSGWISPALEYVVVTITVFAFAMAIWLAYMKK